MYGKGNPLTNPQVVEALNIYSLSLSFSLYLNLVCVCNVHVCMRRPIHPSIHLSI